MGDSRRDLPSCRLTWSMPESDWAARWLRELSSDVCTGPWSSSLIAFNDCRRYDGDDVEMSAGWRLLGVCGRVGRRVAWLRCVHITVSWTDRVISAHLGFSKPSPVSLRSAQSFGLDKSDKKSFLWCLIWRRRKLIWLSKKTWSIRHELACKVIKYSINFFILRHPRSNTERKKEWGLQANDPFVKFLPNNQSVSHRKIQISFNFDLDMSSYYYDLKYLLKDRQARKPRAHAALWINSN